MEIDQILQSVEIFNGLSEDEIRQIARICHQRQLKLGDKIAVQGELNDDLYIVTAGFAEVLLNDNQPDVKVIVNLGEGQVIGEMALVDQGPRSASVRASAEPTVLQVIHREDLEELFNANSHIGYVIMRNIAMDLSFKLRHRNMSHGGR